MRFGENIVRPMCSAPSQPSSARISVLVVDDEESLLDMFEAALSPFFDVVKATNVRDADFQLQRREFKVVVADHLPGRLARRGLGLVAHEHPIHAVHRGA